MGSQSQVTRIILVRHGQTEWNRIERFRGRAGVGLNETGVHQAELTGQRIAADWPSEVAAIYTSPLLRTVQTAGAISARVGLTVIPLPELTDVTVGLWEGLTPDQVHQRWPAELATWRTSPEHFRFPGGESLADVRARATGVLALVAARHEAQTIVLVSHTDVNRILLLSALGLGNEKLRAIQQDNCAINVLECRGDTGALVTLNDTAHLRAWAAFQGAD